MGLEDLTSQKYIIFGINEHLCYAADAAEIEWWQTGL
jgi:hypothetical protein